MGDRLGHGDDAVQSKVPAASRVRRAALWAAMTLTAAAPVFAQVAPATRPALPVRGLATAQYQGRPVGEVRIIGNSQVPTAVIRNAIRIRTGDRFDAATVEEDYQRIYNLRKFSNVEARVEPTATGVDVIFAVSEQKQVNAISFAGNRSVDNQTLRSVIDVQVGEAIDPFRISLARQAIQNLYNTRNFPLAEVQFDQDVLNQRGDLVFRIVEGPRVLVRKVDFKGNTSFSDDRLLDSIKTRPYLFIFRPGRYDPDQIEEDVAGVRRFYESKGFFDAKVGRQIVWSPDLTEVQVNFVIDEGPRYNIDRIRFQFPRGQSLDEAKLRTQLKLVEGRAFDQELQQRDVRSLVRAYGPFGFIYQPQSDNPDPDYLQVDAQHVFLQERGKVELVYTIREGKPFRVGRVIVKGNTRSQDKLVLRELRFAPGDLYNAGELQDATDRIRGTPYFNGVNVTPIGDDPNYRDLLVEVQEARTASFNIGAGVNSNGGVGGNLTFEQRNFDIGNVPTDVRDVFSDRAFVGAGQTFRASFEPGTRVTNATLRFSEPWLFDQPFSFTTELYLRDRVRENYDDRRLGGRVSFGHRFDYYNAVLLNLRAEEVKIHNIDDPEFRAPEILAAEGKSELTSVGLQYRIDTVNPGILPYRGTQIVLGSEFFGALGGDYDFQKYTASFDTYFSLSEDLLDRKTVLGLHLNAGYITGDSFFTERFYGGGIGSIRGFRFRGVSPRGGRAEDPIGGDFALTGSAEVSFPLVGESLRGVAFVDAGTVESDVKFGTIRVSPGVGVRLILPFLGQVPLALDFAYPVVKDDQDDTQFVSFSFGFTP